MLNLLHKKKESYFFTYRLVFDSHYKHNPAYKQSESVGKIFDTKMIFCNLSNDHKTFEEITAS